MGYGKYKDGRRDQTGYSERYDFLSRVDYWVDNRAGNGMIAP